MLKKVFELISLIQGEDGSRFEKLGLKLYNDLGRVFDIVIPDNRGTGQSNPLTCTSNICSTRTASECKYSVCTTTRCKSTSATIVKSCQQVKLAVNTIFNKESRTRANMDRH